MAVNFNTLDGVSNVATEGQRAFNMLSGTNYLDTSNLVQQTIDHLEQKIHDLEKTEQDFLNTFNCDSLGTFAKRVEEYYNNYHMMKFTGVNLQNIVKDFRAQLDAQDLERQRRFNELFQAFLNSYIQGPLTQEWTAMLQGKEVTQALVQEVIGEFIHMINSIRGGGGLQFEAQTRRFSSSTTDTTAALTLVASRGTKAFKTYLDEVYEKAATGAQLPYTSRQGGKKYLQLNTNTHVTSHQATVSFAVKWADIIRSSGTKMLTASEIKDKLQKGELTENDIANKNQEIIKLICKELNVSGEYKKFVENRLIDMLKVDNFMFFVGNSFTGLEGILGEISAVIAITHLLGEKYTDKALAWIGSQPGVYSKKQPSIDLVINNIVDGAVKAQFGLQVKNTVDELNTDISHYVNFANTDVRRILDNAGVGSSAIENVYISDTYNVPYKRIGNIYQEVGYDTTFNHQNSARFRFYTQLDRLIDNIVNSINIYLARFASDFIYMQNPDFHDVLATLDNEVINVNTSGNFCYIVGPKVYFANEMLQDLRNQLSILQSLKRKELQADLQFETYFSKIGEKGGQDFNIVSYMNGKGNLKDYSLKMRSSWGFS